MKTEEAEEQSQADHTEPVFKLGGRALSSGMAGVSVLEG